MTKIRFKKTRADAPAKHRGLKKIGLTLAALAAIVGIGFGLAKPAGAATGDESGLGVTISPTKQRVDLNPGEQKQQAITVINDNDTALTVHLSAAPYSVSDPTYNNQDFTTQTARTQISRWIVFPNSTITLQPHTQTPAPYVVNTPGDVPAGGQYAVIFVTVEPASANGSGGGAQIQISKRAGVLLYANVAGQTREGGQITDWDLPGLVMNGQILAHLKFNNTGNTDYDVTTKLTASNLFGREVYKSDDSAHTILPDTAREMDDLSWDNPPIGIYYVSENISWLDQVVVKGQWVIVMPVWLMIVIIVAILGIIIGIVGLFKAHHARKNQRSTSTY
ncbi:MAG: hypothetical protein LBM73_00605 [Candidatus Nomurabacteria bacterium]|jgi:hypothetical protein|nr:hypothetical protein [Candidatus Nomurabacteria bacterium]